MLSNQAYLSNLEIQQARIKFILFKSKLRSALYGGTLDQSLLSARDNVLGQWIYQSAQPRLGFIAELRDLERLNQEIISEARSLTSMYNRGDIEEARSGLTNLDKHEKDLIRVLGAIESRMAA